MSDDLRLCFSREHQACRNRCSVGPRQRLCDLVRTFAMRRMLFDLARQLGDVLPLVVAACRIQQSDVPLRLVALLERTHGQQTGRSAVVG